MLFYQFDTLDDFIKHNLINNIELEKQNIEEIIELYENKKSNLVAITTNLIEMTNSITKKKLEHFHKTITSLKELLEEINKIQQFASQLETDLNETITLYENSIENNKNEIKANLVEYNKQRDELFNKIIKFENTSTIISNSIIALPLKVPHKKTKTKSTFLNTNITNEKNKNSIEHDPQDHNTLIISEKDQKAFLPFFYSQVETIYKKANHKYKNLQDVIDDLYVLPLNRFKNSAIARFRESFHLIRDKEKGSLTKALDLGLELMFKYELNPIIISACRNLDELDIYLDCLAENELQDFTCFDIKFEIMPQ